MSIQKNIEKCNVALTEIYKPILDNKGNLPTGEFIQINREINGIMTHKDFNNINSVVNECINNRMFYNNLFFSLSTTNGIDRTTENLVSRTCIAFDFDKDKYDYEFTSKHILNIFMGIGLFYHILIDSGHGFHVYILIEPTKNLELVDRVTKALAKKINCDCGALLKTQLLRVPETINCKDKEKLKNVKIIKIDDKIERKTIEQLAKRFLFESDRNINTEFILKENNTPKCVETMLTNGSKKGSRNEDLKKLVVILRSRNKTLAQVKSICYEWNDKCIPSMNNRELEYQIEYIYNNLRVAELNCAKCEQHQECYSKVLSNFEYKEGEKLFKLSENSISKAKNKKSKRKGVVKMNGNMLVIYSVLKNHYEGLYKEELEKELTYKSRKKKIERCAFASETLTKTLKELEYNKFITIETINRKKFYKLNTERVQEKCTFIISYSATMEFIKGNISSEEYELYCYMRYLHNKLQREDCNALKGNLFRINQDDLAKDLGVTQGRISQMINNLIDEKLLSIWYRGKKENSTFYYNVYTLNY